MKRPAGFTLVEILVAMTLLAVVGTALLQLFSSGLRSARQAGEHSRAALLAQSTLTELRAYSQLRPGTLSGIYDDGYRWRAELVPAAADEAPATVRLLPLAVTITIDWGDPGNERSFILHSLLLSRSLP